MDRKFFNAITKSFLVEVLLRFSSVILLIFLVFSFTFYWIFKLNNQINNMNVVFEHLTENFLIEKINFRDFQLFDVKNEEFFRTSKSKYIDEVQRAHKQFQKYVVEIKKFEFKKNQFLFEELASIEDLYNKKTIEAIELTKKLGFKDWGLEGEWRENIHKFENLAAQLDHQVSLNNNYAYMVHYLQIRRHEKDYLLRNDQTALEFLNDEITQLKKKIKNDNRFQKDDIIFIDNYVQSMDKYVLLLKLKTTTEKDLLSFENKIQNIEAEYSSIFESESNGQKYRLIFVIALFGLINLVLLWLLTLKQARSILNPIHKIGEYLNSVGHGNYEKDLNLERNDDFKKLEIEFNKMLNNLRVSKKQFQMATIGEVSANIAHDISGPLLVIKLSIAKLETHLSESEGHIDKQTLVTAFDKINRSVHRIIKITEGIKALAHQKVSLGFENVNLYKIIEESLFFVEHKTTQAQVKVIFESSEIDCMIYCDHTLISQVFVNLLSNAVDAIENLEERWIQIEVIKKNDIVAVQITDSGYGLPQHIKNNLFKVSMSTKEVGKGTGLGLTISKSIIEQHSGMIEVVDSEHTRFLIQLPMVVDKSMSALSLQSQVVAIAKPKAA